MDFTFRWSTMLINRDNQEVSISLTRKTGEESVVWVLTAKVRMVRTATSKPSNNYYSHEYFRSGQFV
jgi:hypothetical protein